MQITDLVFIDSTGYHFSDYPSFLSWLQDQYRAIYGADVYLEADSQDGQFLAILAKAFYDTAALGASVFNSFSPVTAQGVGLSRLVKINGLTKGVPTNSTVDLTIVGQAGTVITGGIAADTLNQKWNLPTTTIPGGGSIVVTATADQPGAVTADAATVTTIFTPTLGWQTVNNVAAATPGAPVESDAALRVRQAASTANPSLTVLDGTVGAVENLPGVTKARGYENDSGSADGNGVPGHSVAISVLGGVSADIANAIAVHKTPGAGTFGNTTVNVTDAHGMPLAIEFNRPTIAHVQATVTISLLTGWSSDYATLIKNSVAAAINAGRIGDPILFTKMFTPAYLLGTPPGQTFDIATITLGKNGGSQSAANVTLGYNEYPSCDPLVDVTVTIT